MPDHNLPSGLERFGAQFDALAATDTALAKRHRHDRRPPSRNDGRRESTERGRWRPSARAALLAAGLVAVSGTAVAAVGGGWHPSLGSGGRDRPTAATVPVPPALSAELAVLRRPQNAVDRGPEARAVLRLMFRGETNDVYLDGVRVLSRRNGGAAVLVPVGRAGRHLPGSPSNVRRNALCLFISSKVDPASATPTGAGLPLGTVAGQMCGDLTAVRSRGISLQTPADGQPVTTFSRDRRQNPHWRVSTLVPDGVARVKVRVRGGRTLTTEVHNNLYELDTGPGPAADLGTVWLDADGRRIDHRKR